MKKQTRPIRVATVFSNALFSQGISRLLEGSEGIRVLRGPGKRKASSGHHGAEVLIVDFIALYNMVDPKLLKGARGIILLDTGLSEENIRSAFFTKGVRGFVGGKATIETLERAIRAVAGGEVWVEREASITLLSAMGGLESERKSILSEAERKILSLARSGYDERAMASRLGMGIKTVQRKIEAIIKGLDRHATKEKRPPRRPS